MYRNEKDNKRKKGEKMRKRGLLMFVVILFGLMIVYAGSFSDITQSDFSNGTYANTTHNGLALVLSGSNTTGTYTSRVFDATSVARWNNISLNKQNFNKTYLFAVDLSDSVYSSNNSGINWTLINSSYGTTDGQGMFSNSNNNLYIISNTNKEVWKSTNSGVSWNIVNKTFSTNNLFAGTSDTNGYLFVAAGTTTGIIFKSSDNGITWTNVNSTLNLGNSATTKGMTSNSTSGLFLVSGGGYVYSSINSGVSWNLVNSTYGRTTGAVGMFSDNNNNIYIITDTKKEVWKSTNSGVSWNIVNETFSSANLLAGNGDANGNIYVADANGGVYKSSNQGMSWTLISDFNGASTSDAVGIANIFSQTNLTFQIKNCSLADCSDGSWQNANLSNINLTGRYFQYNAYFTSQDTSITPALYNLSLDYTILDNVPPSFSNLQETPANGTAYSSSQVYQFNATVTEDNPAQVWIEFNGANYTAGITNLSNVFSFNRTNLAAGTYQYKWWANDSLGNINSSETRYYAINKSSSTTTLTTTPASPINYGTESNFSCYNSANLNMLIDMKRDDSMDGDDITSENSLNLVRAAGSYTITCVSLANQNYTGSSNQSLYTINKIAPTLTKMLNGIDNNLSVQYPQQINASGSTNAGSLAIYREGNIINNGENYSLGADYYRFDFNVTGNQNYTNASGVLYANLSKASSTITLIFDKVSPQTYETAVNASCTTTNPESSAKLYRNGTDVSSSENSKLAVLAAGTHNYICNVSSSQNYSSATTSDSFAINKATPILTFLANSGISNLTLIYPQEVNISATSNFGTIALERNSISVLSENSLNTSLAAGSYIYRANVTGNQNYSDVSYKYYNITINKGNSAVYTYLNNSRADIGVEVGSAIDLNATRIYGEGVTKLYKNGVLINSGISLYNLTQFSNIGIFNITAIHEETQNYTFSSETFFVNVTDSIPPSISIASPQDGTTYGFNDSIPLNFSVYDSGAGIDSCWYNINNGNNISLPNCGNSSFSVPANGNYLLALFSNDSAGNLNRNNVSFDVNIGAPTIILRLPVNIYLSNSFIAFAYVPSDTDGISTCELWGNFNSEFKLNQTQVPINNAENYFYLNLSDGTYIWNIRCVDDAGHISFNGNKTFYVDTTPPKITISEPTGTKSSWLNIPLTFAINDSSPANCKYNVNWATGGNFISNTSIANCASTTFNLSSVGDYILNLYATDFANNSNFLSSSFSVSTSTPIQPSNPSGGGQGGGIVPTANATKLGLYKIEISGLSDISMKAGESQTLSASVKNAGNNFLNNCKIKGENVVSKESKGLSPGQISDFVFIVSMPQDASEDKTTSLQVICDETQASSNFKISLAKELVEIKIKKMEQSANKFSFVYSIKNLADKQELSAEFWISDEQGKRIAEDRDYFSIEAGQEIDKIGELTLPSGVTGEHVLSMKISSKTGFSYVQESVILGKQTGFIGRAILTPEGGRAVSIIVIIIIALVIVMIILKKIIKKPVKEDRYGYVRVKLRGK